MFKSFLAFADMSNPLDWWPLALLVVGGIALFAFSYFNRRKYSKQETEMRQGLKVGDKVVTNAGVYGVILSIQETNFGKVVLLETGEGNKKSYLSVNASVILGIDLKEPVVLDENGNIISPEGGEDLNAQAKQIAKKDKEDKHAAKSTAKEDKAAEDMKEVKVENTPAAKTHTDKTSKK